MSRWRRFGEAALFVLETCIVFAAVYVATAWWVRHAGALCGGSGPWACP